MFNLSKRAKISLVIAIAIMGTFIVGQFLSVFGVITPGYETTLFGLICVFTFMPPFAVIVAEVVVKQKETTTDLNRKNIYIEHAAKILRHDMHSGINTYIPRGVKSLERRIDEETLRELRLESPIKLIKEGLNHAQRVYKGVYEFTNLVRAGSHLEKEEVNIRQALLDHMGTTSYIDQVLISKDLPELLINESLFCTAVDNFIRNGLKYNDSPSKLVEIKMEDEETLIIVDNGRGMTQREFEYYSKPYTRKRLQEETGSGLGMNIAIAILKEHGFKITCKKLERGTKIRIKVK